MKKTKDINLQNPLVVKQIIKNMYIKEEIQNIELYNLVCCVNSIIVSKKLNLTPLQILFYYFILNKKMTVLEISKMLDIPSKNIDSYLQRIAEHFARYCVRNNINTINIEDKIYNKRDNYNV